MATKKLLEMDNIDAVITLGAVITGETKHDEVVVAQASRKIMDLGLTTKSLTTYSSESAREDDKLILALCLPVGEDASGKPVYGPLQHVLIVNGQVKHLEDYRSK